jgi:membrane protein
MKKKNLIFIQSLVDEREEFEENIYLSIYFKILYYFFLFVITFFYFVILFYKIDGNAYVLKYEVPRKFFIVLEMLILYFSLKLFNISIQKWQKNWGISVSSFVLVLLFWIIFGIIIKDSGDWIHWTLLGVILFIIIIYRFLIINNLNVQISKIDNNLEEQIIKIGYLKVKPNDEFNITLFKGNLRDKTRDVFIKKVKNSYNNLEEEDYKELKENIKKIYNEQKLENFIKKLSIFIPVISFTGKFLYDYFEKNKNIFFEKILTFNNIKNWIMGFKLQDILNIIFFLIVFFIVAHFIYKIFELRFRNKRGRINEVAECIEILRKKTDEKNSFLENSFKKIIEKQKENKKNRENKLSELITIMKEDDIIEVLNNILKYMQINKHKW